MSVVTFDHPLSEAPIAGSPEWEAFESGPIWADFRNFLIERLEIVHRELVGAETWEQTLRLQEEAKFAQTILGLPEFFKAQAKLHEVKNSE